MPFRIRGHRHHRGIRVTIGQLSQLIAGPPGSQAGHFPTQTVRYIQGLQSDRPGRPEDDKGTHR